MKTQIIRQELEKLRKELLDIIFSGGSLREIEDKTGTNFATISKIKAGKLIPKIENLLSLAEKIEKNS